jgi:hypothetical protein
MDTKSKQLGIYLLSALAVGLLSASANAAVTYTDRATFLASVSGETNYDFEVGSGFPAAPASLTSFAGGSVLLSTDGGDPAAALQPFASGSFGQAIGGQAGGEVNNFKALRLTLAVPMFAMGFDDLDLTGLGGVPDELAIINVEYSNGAPAEQYSVTDGDADFATAAFFGIVSANPIASIQVFSADTLESPPGGRANLIDNVILVVPEPATGMLLVGAAVATIGTFRRRRI